MMIVLIYPVLQVHRRSRSSLHSLLQESHRPAHLLVSDQEDFQVVRECGTSAGRVHIIPPWLLVGHGLSPV